MAKEQGLRSRAAFKLSQINRQYNILSKAKHGILDLCAAPGGWTQVCQRTCPSALPIVAVDILPIRGFGAQNITTLIGDITTDKCKADIRQAIQQVDVVLHDGAPNVGADYAKDAYEQNEIALHALKCATQHLVRGGVFCTKVYRSRDYASFNWVLSQLFSKVQALKPKASRMQSAEIFLICTDYQAPQKVDARLLDPKHVFANVEGNTTGGGNSATAVSIFHKNFGKKTRQRSGYDHEQMDFTMRRVTAVSDFVQANLKDAVEILSTSTGLSFKTGKDEDETEVNEFLLNHPMTNPEIKECLSDLKVLNKSDFKGLLAWRTRMQQALESRKEEEREEKSSMNDKGETEDILDSDGEEEQIQAEIEQMRQRRLREKKRAKKKLRAAASKRRRAAALGMDLNAIDVPEHDALFSLAQISNKGDLLAASEVNLDEVDMDYSDDDSDEVVLGQDVNDDESDDGKKEISQREKDLNDAYNRYISNTKDGMAKSGTKMAKRSKKQQRIQMMEEAEEDQEMMQATDTYIKGDTKAYAKMLLGNSDDSEDDDESDDGFDAEPMTPKEHEEMKRRQKSTNPLIHKFAEESASAKTARWFSNPLFQTIGKAAQSVQQVGEDDKEKKPDTDDSKKTKQTRLDADEVLAMMPKTDKEKRHEKRLKAKARDERRQVRKAKRLGEIEGEFELAPADNNQDGEDEDLKNLPAAQRKKVLEARELIKAGMGQTVPDDGKSGFAIVSESELPRMDDRMYDSDHEVYDSDDYAETLALGTMMLRKSKERALVDASYNRFAWNDPSGLPDWFVDDENRHYRPQLPIPPTLLAKMKEKMLALSTKPIAKVAEARARKQKRARDKLAAAKKQADSVANNPDMSEAMKLKAISKALRGQESKKPSKTYVVAKKGRGNVGAKGVKVVDKRLKSDKRAMERSEKKRRKGKQGGLVGSKKRRNHK